MGGEGHSLYKNPHPRFGDLQLIVVGRFGPKDQESYPRVRRVFAACDVKLFKTTELSELIAEYRRRAKDIAERGAATERSGAQLWPS